MKQRWNFKVFAIKLFVFKFLCLLSWFCKYLDTTGLFDGQKTNSCVSETLCCRTRHHKSKWWSSICSGEGDLQNACAHQAFLTKHRYCMNLHGPGISSLKVQWNTDWSSQLTVYYIYCFSSFLQPFCMRPFLVMWQLYFSKCMLIQTDIMKCWTVSGTF